MSKAHETSAENPIDSKLPGKEEIARFITMQESELQTRNQDIELRKEEIKFDAQNARHAIEAELESERIEHQSYLTAHKHRMWLFGVLAVAVLSFAAFTMYLKQPDVVLELIKLSAAVVGAGLGGYAYGYRKGGEQNDD